MYHKYANELLPVCNQKNTPIFTSGIQNELKHYRT